MSLEYSPRQKQSTLRAAPSEVLSSPNLNPSEKVPSSRLRDSAQVIVDSALLGVKIGRLATDVFVYKRRRRKGNDKEKRNGGNDKDKAKDQLPKGVSRFRLRKERGARHSRDESPREYKDLSPEEIKALQAHESTVSKLLGRKIFYRGRREKRKLSEGEENR